MTTQTDTTAEQAYSAAHSAAIYVDRSNLGMLKINGKTRLDLIHRMSTQAIIDLKSGEGAATILTSDIGRIIDRLILYVSSDTVYALTGENNGIEIGRYLMRFVFWGDDFKLDDLSNKTVKFGVYGAQAKLLLADAGFPEVDLPLHHWRQVTLDDGVTAYVHRTDPVAGDGYFVMGMEADRAALEARLQSAGIVAADEATFDYLRIESGQPRFGRELSLDYIPLEANLWADVSFNKGCYTGQEIIARMESRGKLAKQVKRLQLDGVVEVGAQLKQAGKRAGVVTSVGDGPAGFRALAYVRTAALDKEEALKIGDVTASIVD